MSSPLIFKSVAELSAMLAAKSISASELMQAFVARTTAVEGRVHAFNSRDEVGALGWAAASDARRAAGQRRQARAPGRPAAAASGRAPFTCWRGASLPLGW